MTWVQFVTIIVATFQIEAFCIRPQAAYGQLCDFYRFSFDLISVFFPDFCIFFIIFTACYMLFIQPLLLLLLLLLILPFYLNMPHMQSVAELLLTFFYWKLIVVHFSNPLIAMCVCRCVPRIKIGRWLIIAFLFNLILLAHKFLSSRIELTLKNDYFYIRAFCIPLGYIYLCCISMSIWRMKLYWN